MVFTLIKFQLLKENKMIGYKILNNLKIKEVEYVKSKNASALNNELYIILSESRYNLYLLDIEDGILFSTKEQAIHEVRQTCLRRISKAETEIIKYNNILKNLE